MDEIADPQSQPDDQSGPTDPEDLRGTHENPTETPPEAPPPEAVPPEAVPSTTVLNVVTGLLIIPSVVEGWSWFRATGATLSGAFDLSLFYNLAGLACLSGVGVALIATACSVGTAVANREADPRPEALVGFVFALCLFMLTVSPFLHRIGGL